MIVKRNKNRNEHQENIFWMTMADLLLGLVIVFITLFVLAMTGYTQDKAQTQAAKEEIAKELNESLNKNGINATVDSVTGKINISDLELFEVGDYHLSPKGRAYLNKFIPIYLDIILGNEKLSNKLENIVIQGHTDSQSFVGVKSPDLQFVKNMELSTQRANAVAEYIFYTGYNKKYSKKLRKIIQVEGKSYTEPVLVNGKEDYAKSRRVELELVVKDASITDFMGIK